MIDCASAGTNSIGNYEKVVVASQRRLRVFGHRAFGSTALQQGDRR